MARDYYIADPITGETYYFSARYGDPAKGIYGLRLYQGPVVIQEDDYKVIYKGQTLASYERNPIDQIDQLNRELEGARTNLAQEVQNCASLQAALTQQEADNAQIMGNLRRTEKERDDAKADLKEVRSTALDILGIDVCAIDEVRELSRAFHGLRNEIEELSIENMKLTEKIKKDFTYRKLIGKLFIGRWK